MKGQIYNLSNFYVNPMLADINIYSYRNLVVNKDFFATIVHDFVVCNFETNDA